MTGENGDKDEIRKDVSTSDPDRERESWPGFPVVGGYLIPADTFAEELDPEIRSAYEAVMVLLDRHHRRLHGPERSPGRPQDIDQQHDGVLIEMIAAHEGPSDALIDGLVRLRAGQLARVLRAAILRSCDTLEVGIGQRAKLQSGNMFAMRMIGVGLLIYGTTFGFVSFKLTGLIVYGGLGLVLTGISSAVLAMAARRDAGAKIRIERLERLAEKIGEILPVRARIGEERHVGRKRRTEPATKPEKEAGD